MSILPVACSHEAACPHNSTAATSIRAPTALNFLETLMRNVLVPTPMSKVESQQLCLVVPSLVRLSLVT